MPGSTRKKCVSCQATIGVASKKCKFCGEAQPYKALKMKKLEKLKQRMKVSPHGLKANAVKVVDAAYVHLHNLQAAGYFPILLLGKKKGPKVSADVLTLSENPSRQEHMAYKTIQSHFEDFLKVHFEGTTCDTNAPFTTCTSTTDPSVSIQIKVHPSSTPSFQYTSLPISTSSSCFLVSSGSLIYTQSNFTLSLCSSASSTPVFSTFTQLYPQTTPSNISPTSTSTRTSTSTSDLPLPSCSMCSTLKGKEVIPFEGAASQIVPSLEEKKLEKRKRQREKNKTPKHPKHRCELTVGAETKTDSQEEKNIPLTIIGLPKEKDHLELLSETEKAEESKEPPIKYHTLIPEDIIFQDNMSWPDFLSQQVPRVELDSVFDLKSMSMEHPSSMMENGCSVLQNIPDALSCTSLNLTELECPDTTELISFGNSNDMADFDVPDSYTQECEGNTEEGS